MFLEIVLLVALILFGLATTTDNILVLRQRQRDEGKKNTLFL